MPLLSDTSGSALLFHLPLEGLPRLVQRALQFLALERAIAELTFQRGPESLLASEVLLELLSGRVRGYTGLRIMIPCLPPASIFTMSGRGTF